MATDKDTTTTRTAKDAGEEVAKATRGAVAEAADTGKKVSRDAAETAEKNADAVARTADRGAEVAKRSIEATQDVADKSAQTLRSAAEKANETASRITSDAAGATRQVAEQATQQFGRVFSLQAKASEEVANRTQQNLEVLLQTSSLLAEGFQSVLREWMNYTQSAVQRNIDGMNSIMRARTVQDLVAAQSDLLNAEVQLLLNSSVKVSEVTARVANDAAKRINGHSQQQARRTA